MDSEAKGGGGRGGGGRLSTRAAAALATQHSRGGKVVGAIGEAASRWERAAANGTAIKRNAEGCEPARCASHSPRHLAPTGPPGAACKRCECWPARAPSDLQADGRARACKVSSGGGAVGCATAIRRRQLHRGRPPPPPCVGMPCCGLHLALNSSHIRLPKRRMSMPVPLKDWEKKSLLCALRPEGRGHDARQWPRPRPPLWRCAGTSRDGWQKLGTPHCAGPSQHRTKRALAWWEPTMARTRLQPGAAEACQGEWQAAHSKQGSQVCNASRQRRGGTEQNHRLRPAQPAQLRLCPEHLLAKGLGRAYGKMDHA